MKDEMMAKIMDEVMKKMGGTEAPAQSMACEAPQGINEDLCGLTEYVGTAMGHTIGLVIANLDYSVHELLKIDPKYRSIGIIADRTGAGPQIFACDEAVKATNTEVCLIECPRDTEGSLSPCFALYWQKAFSTQKTEKNTSRDYLFLHFYQKYLMTWHSTICLLQHLIPFYIYKNCHLLTFQPPFKSKMYYSPYF